MRHLPLPAAPCVPARHAFSDAAVRGDLSSLAWFQGRVDPDRPLLAPGHSLVHVHYAALNFRDVLLASGKLDAEALACGDSESILGFEFSGILSNGRRVMGMKLGGSVSTEVLIPDSFLWDVPDIWTLLEAATIPVAYSTAVFALEMVGRMAAGESVLVHAASGAVGQAALTLALARGCRVFATVGSQLKKDFLLRAFPQIPPDDIGSSRDVSFEPLVLRRTGGRGVDLVLNSLADDKLQASLRCLASGGRFLEIGKVDMVNNSPIGMRLLLREAVVHGILLDELLAHADSPRMRELSQRLRQLVEEGVARPIHTEVFPRDQVEQAFRHMAAGKHIGKVVVAVREEHEAGPLTLPARPRFYCQQDASYVLVGGLGGLGLELAHWMVQRGARHLVLVSRRGVTTGYQARRLQQWRAKGVRALVLTDDSATRRGAEALLRAAGSVAPVAAVFNLAVVLRDALFENQTAPAFVESCRCKAAAAVQLDAASRRLCPRLRHFVLFSSVSCGRGNAGQTNYGLANAVMECVARARRAAGLPAMAVQWGAVGDVGLVADMRDDDRVLEIGGTLQQSLASCLEVLDGFLAQRHPVVASMVVAEKRAGAGGDDLMSSVAALLGLRDLKTLSLESTLAELGMDSMLAVEVQQTLARDFDLLLSPQDVRALTFGRLREYQRAKEDKERKARAAPASAAQLAEASASSPAAHRPNGGLQNGSGAKAAVATEALRLLVGSMVDELTAAKSVVPLPAAPAEGEMERGGMVVLFPGAEGVVAPLESLARALCLRVVGLQLPLETVPSVPAILDIIMPHVKALVGEVRDAGGYVLLGYSFGGLLALEAAARFQAEGLGKSCHLVLLDSAPDFMRGMMKRMGDVEGSEEIDEERRLQEVILVHLTQTVLPDMTTVQLQELRESLRAQKSWEARLRLYAERTLDTGHSTKIKMAALDAFYRRLLSALYYCWPQDRPPLQATVTLIRPTLSGLPSGFLPEDYGLSQICEGPVRVHYVEGADHHSLPSKRQTAALVNAALEAAQIFEAVKASPQVDYHHKNLRS